MAERPAGAPGNNAFRRTMVRAQQLLSLSKAVGRARISFGEITGRQKRSCQTSTLCSGQDVAFVIQVLGPAHDERMVHWSPHQPHLYRGSEVTHSEQWL